MTDGSVLTGQPEHPGAEDALPIPPGVNPAVPSPAQRRVTLGLCRGGRGARGTEEDAVTRKPTVEELGVDLDAQDWRRSGDRDGAIEIAFVPETADDRTEYVLMRVAGDTAGRVLVYDRHEWECFLDGVRNGEFDEGA
jgi:Domain of unknown function (DUF397)